MSCAIQRGVPNENGAAAAVGSAVDVAVPNENPDVWVAGVVPNPKLVVDAAGAPKPPIGVVVNPGVVSEKAGADEAVFA